MAQGGIGQADLDDLIRTAQERPRHRSGRNDTGSPALPQPDSRPPAALDPSGFSALTTIPGGSTLRTLNFLRALCAGRTNAMPDQPSPSGPPILWPIWINALAGSLVVTVGLWMSLGGLSPSIATVVAIGVAAFLVWRGTSPGRVWAWTTLFLGLESLAWPVLTMIRVRMPPCGCGILRCTSSS